MEMYDIAIETRLSLCEKQKALPGIEVICSVTNKLKTEGIARYWSYLLCDWHYFMNTVLHTSGYTCITPAFL